MDLLSPTRSAVRRVCSICGNRTVDHHIDWVIKCTVIVIIAHVILFYGFFADYPLRPQKLSPALRPWMPRVGPCPRFNGRPHRGGSYLRCVYRVFLWTKQQPTSAVVCASKRMNKKLLSVLASVRAVVRSGGWLLAEGLNIDACVRSIID